MFDPRCGWQLTLRKHSLGKVEALMQCFDLPSMLLPQFLKGGVDRMLRVLDFWWPSFEPCSEPIADEPGGGEERKAEEVHRAS